MNPHVVRKREVILDGKAELLNRLIAYLLMPILPDYQVNVTWLPVIFWLTSARDHRGGMRSALRNRCVYKQLLVLSEDEVVRHSGDVIADNTHRFTRKSFTVTRWQRFRVTKVIVKERCYHHFGVVFLGSQRF